MNASCKTDCKTSQFSAMLESPQSLALQGGAGRGNRTLVFSLEGWDQRRNYNGLPVKLAKTGPCGINRLPEFCKTGEGVLGTYFEDRLAEIEGAPTAKMLALAAKRRQYVQTEKTRHGRSVFYFRKGAGPRIRLPDPEKVGPVAFNQAYAAAWRGEIATPASEARTAVAMNGEPGRLGYVYFLKMGGVIKIGFSTSVGRRLKTIQTSCPEPAEIVNIIPGSDQTERYFHEHFADYRQSGEWFRLEGALAAFLALSPHRSALLAGRL